MSLSKDAQVYVSDRKAHYALLKRYLEENWACKDVEVDWEWSGPGMYRIHEHTGAELPCVSLKWEGV